MPIPPVPVTPINHLESIDNKLTAIEAALAALAPMPADVAAIAVDVAALEVLATDSKALLVELLRELRGPADKKRIWQNVDLPPYNLRSTDGVERICSWVSFNTDGDRLAVELEGETPVIADTGIDDPTKWTIAGADCAISGSACKWTSNSNASLTQATPDLDAGAYYFMVCTIANRTAGSLLFYAGTTAGTRVLNSNKTWTEFVLASGAAGQTVAARLLGVGAILDVTDFWVYRVVGELGANVVWPMRARKVLASLLGGNIYGYWALYS
jgi:hypothetical protein